MTPTYTARVPDAPLASWSDTAIRWPILDLVERVTDQRSPGYVPPDGRLVVIDNDGTLWYEKPGYIQAAFLVRRFREMATRDPHLADKQPYAAALAEDFGYFAAYQEHVAELAEAIAAAFAGVTTDAFAEAVSDFFAAARHPRFGVSYKATAYRPMRELIELLRLKGFLVFIVTTAGRDFVRVVSDELYGVPREQVIGSSVRLEWRGGALIRLPALTLPIADGPGKPVHIFERLGRLPLLAIGNSDGDFEMLETARFGILIHHDDAEREYACDAGAERILAAAPARQWIVVSMKDDWKTVFA